MSFKIPSMFRTYEIESLENCFFFLLNFWKYSFFHCILFSTTSWSFEICYPSFRPPVATINFIFLIQLDAFTFFCFDLTFFNDCILFRTLGDIIIFFLKIGLSLFIYLLYFYLWHSVYHA